MAQLDNAADSDSEERGFESLWAGQKKDSNTQGVAIFFIFTPKGIRTRNGSELGA